MNKSTALDRNEKNLLLFYRTSICPKLKESLGLKNVMQIPKISKIVLNVGSKEAVSDSKVLKVIIKVLRAVTAQAPVKTFARTSIAGFKIREGMSIGVRVTLRGLRMYIFLDKLINLSLPKTRDFQGVSEKLDGRGNYNIGIKDWNIFPEAEAAGAYDKTSGLNITIQTTAKNDDHGRALLREFGMPFKKKIDR